MSEELLEIVRNVKRLAALQRVGLLDTPREETIDRLTNLTRRILKAPVALVDRDRQFFKSCAGLPEPWASRRETPLTQSFCKHVVARVRAEGRAQARKQRLATETAPS